MTSFIKAMIDRIPPPTASDVMLDILSGYGPLGLSVQGLRKRGLVMDISESNVRVALNRLANQRKIASPRRGHYAINFSGYALHEDVENWWRREEQRQDWDFTWVAVHEPIKVRGKTAQQRMHSRALELRGFRPARPNLHVRPNNLSGGVYGLRKQLLELGMSDSAVVFGMNSLSRSEEAYARALWVGSNLINDYRDYLEAIKQSTKHLASISKYEACKESLLLGRSAIRFLLHDPLLPEELMPGAERKVLVSEVREYQLSARELWRNVVPE